MNDLKGFRVKGLVRDIASFLRVVPERRSAMRKGLFTEPEGDYIRELANALHPDRQFLLVDSVRNETVDGRGMATARTYRLVPETGKGTGTLAWFRPGQFLSISSGSGRERISRPYSISSAPSDISNGYYEITLRKNEGGLMTTRAWESWINGASLVASAPMGFMHHEPLRDSKSIVGLAGGCGVTPFRSIVREIAAGNLAVSLNLIYGVSGESDILFRKELEGYAASMPDRFRLTYVISGKDALLPTAENSDPGFSCRKGFITAELLAECSDPLKDSYFICGPAVMYSFTAAELAKMKVPGRRIRRETFGEVKSPLSFPGYPREAAECMFDISVQRGDFRKTFRASGNESLLVALEREGISIPSACRSGECQVCRSRMSLGRVWSVPENDGRRSADARAGYIHPCTAFPLSDIELTLPPFSDTALCVGNRDLITYL